jgi:hypothetical protein
MGLPPLPFKGSTVAKRTPLDQLSDAALEQLCGMADRYPEAARAAGILRHHRQTAEPEPEAIPF